MTLTDSDLMPFGSYKGTLMDRVPARYLLWLWEDGIWEARSKLSRPEAIAVHDYIKRSFTALEQEPHDVIINHRPK